MATASFNARLNRINKKGPGTYVVPGPAHNEVRYGSAATCPSGKRRRSWISTMLGGFFGVGAGMYYALVMADVTPWTVDFSEFREMLQAEQLALALVRLALPLILIGFLTQRVRPGIMNFATTYLLGMVAAYYI
jgi:hypothetical protein